MDFYKKIEINPKITSITECSYFLLAVYEGIAQFLLDSHLYKNRPLVLDPPTTMDFITHFTVPIFLVLTILLGTLYVRKCLALKTFQIELLSPVFFVILEIGYISAIPLTAKDSNANFFFLFPTSVYILLNLVFFATKVYYTAKLFKN